MASFETSFRYTPTLFSDDGERINPEPQQIYGRIYSIGTPLAGSYLIESSDGLVIIDNGIKEDGDTIIKNIQKLGYDPANIKLILITHWHWDHCGNINKMLEFCNPEIMCHKAEVGYIRSGMFRGAKFMEPSVITTTFKDGDLITQGDISIRAIHTPGQSPGSAVYMTDVPGPQGICKALFAGDATGFKTNIETLELLGYPGVVEDYRATVDILQSLGFDLYLGGHGHQVYKEMREDGNPFVIREEFHKMVDKRYEEMEEFVKKHPKYLEW